MLERICAFGLHASRGLKALVLAVTVAAPVAGAATPRLLVTISPSQQGKALELRAARLVPESMSCRVVFKAPIRGTGPLRFEILAWDVGLVDSDAVQSHVLPFLGAADERFETPPPEAIVATCVPATFAGWCADATTTTPGFEPMSSIAQRYTTRKVLEQLGTTDCDDALEVLQGTETLDLAGKALTDMLPLGSLKRLRRLVLADNDITTLEGVEAMTRLESLDVSLNALRTLAPLRGLPRLKSLNVSGNRALTSLQGVDGLPNLERLTAVGLAVARLPELAGLGRLAQLDLRFGAVADVAALTSAAALTQLQLAGNPIAQPAARTPENCPRDAGPAVLRDFCLEGAP